MRKITATLAASLLIASTAAYAAPRLEPEARLARALDGRVAGEPVNCINLRNVRSSQIIDRTAIIYDTGGTIYVNRPRAGRESLDRWDTLVTRTHSSRLCSIDVVQLFDPGSRMQTGLVFLGDFVPYKRAR
ncbi:MAG: hypothetical protein M3Q08_01125 [Pseudomonadota bacterium]|nr:hypothetical protein [Pseudomonadota bacterium]